MLCEPVCNCLFNVNVDQISYIYRNYHFSKV